MKRLFVIAIVAMFGFAFGCGGAPAADIAAPEAPEVEAPAVGEELEAAADEVEGEIAPEEAAEEAPVE